MRKSLIYWAYSGSRVYKRAARKGCSASGTTHLYYVIILLQHDIIFSHFRFLQEHEKYRVQLHEQLLDQRKIRDIAYAEACERDREETEARKALQDAEALQAQEEARAKAALVREYREARRKEQEQRDAEAARLRIEYEQVLFINNITEICI